MLARTVESAIGRNHAWRALTFLLPLACAAPLAAQPNRVFKMEGKAEPNPFTIACQATIHGTDRHRVPVAVHGKSLTGAVETVGQYIQHGYHRQTVREGDTDYAELTQRVAVTMKMHATLKLAVSVTPFGASVGIVDFHMDDAELEQDPPDQSLLSDESRQQIGTRLKARLEAAKSDLRGALHVIESQRLEFPQTLRDRMQTEATGHIFHTIPLSYCGQENQIKIRVRWDRRINTTPGPP